MVIFHILHMRLLRLKSSVTLLSTYVWRKSRVIHSDSANRKILVRGLTCSFVVKLCSISCYFLWFKENFLDHATKNIPPSSSSIFNSYSNTTGKEGSVWSQGAVHRGALQRQTNTSFQLKKQNHQDWDTK